MAKLFDYKLNTGIFNMSEDERLLEYSIENNLKTPILRFYGWSPACVSLGRNQSESGINIEYCKNHNIQIVRRLTGGRAVLHDNELTYSFICPVDFLNCSDSVILSYKEISSALALGFKNLDIELSFPQDKKPNSKFDYCMSISTGADLSYFGKKLVGSAQFRKQKYILQHGSILFDYDKTVIESVFGEIIPENSIISMKEIDPSITPIDLSESITKGFEAFFNLTLQKQ